MTRLAKIIAEMREASRKLGRVVQFLEQDYFGPEDIEQVRSIRGQVDNWHGQLKGLAEKANANYVRQSEASSALGAQLAGVLTQPEDWLHDEYVGQAQQGHTSVYFNGENGECWGALNFGTQYRIGAALAEGGLLVVEQLRGRNFYLYHRAMSYAWDEYHWWGPTTELTDRLLPQFGGTKDGELLYPQWLQEQRHAAR